MEHGNILAGRVAAFDIRSTCSLIGPGPCEQDRDLHTLHFLHGPLHPSSPSEPTRTDDMGLSRQCREPRGKQAFREAGLVLSDSGRSLALVMFIVGAEAGFQVPNEHLVTDL